MTKSTFIKMLRLMKEADKQRDELYRLGIQIDNETDFEILSIIAKEAFGEQGWDWVNWWRWEVNYGRGYSISKPAATNNDGTPFIWNEASLWRAVKLTTKQREDV
ncbi:hypothetical protein [Geitlerinema calcuttense]|uniref:Uncharacterized protein n=1 Tax=Geitlerinema calcuttense NRMC-F 0142 TaxID=2922238 RepID=A0ABT7LV55_9CYAN|nr:hypothetical protein [Geitlerinema calcuttense]MDL5055926.1 hypothetical protein [Geitlerinema calcuttense NRMC-F 0142]